jgi:hypothetical protein
MSEFESVNTTDISFVLETNSGRELLDSTSIDGNGSELAFTLKVILRVYYPYIQGIEVSCENDDDGKTIVIVFPEIVQEPRDALIRLIYKVVNKYNKSRAN